MPGPNHRGEAARDAAPGGSAKSMSFFIDSISIFRDICAAQIDDDDTNGSLDNEDSAPAAFNLIETGEDELDWN